MDKALINDAQSLNPGALKSDLGRHMPWYLYKIIVSTAQLITSGSVSLWLTLRGKWYTLLHDPIYGAYTELFAGLSPEADASKNGAYSKILPQFCL